MPAGTFGVSAPPKKKRKKAKTFYPRGQLEPSKAPPDYRKNYVNLEVKHAVAVFTDRGYFIDPANPSVRHPLVHLQFYMNLAGVVGVYKMMFRRRTGDAQETPQASYCMCDRYVVTH